jgi:hypothetical protein
VASKLRARLDTHRARLASTAPTVCLGILTVCATVLGPAHDARAAWGPWIYQVLQNGSSQTPRVVPGTTDGLWYRSQAAISIVECHGNPDGMLVTGGATCHASELVPHLRAQPGYMKADWNYNGVCHAGSGVPGSSSTGATLAVGTGKAQLSAMGTTSSWVTVPGEAGPHVLHLPNGHSFEVEGPFATTAVNSGTIYVRPEVVERVLASRPRSAGATASLETNEALALERVAATGSRASGAFRYLGPALAVLDAIFTGYRFYDFQTGPKTIDCADVTRPHSDDPTDRAFEFLALEGINRVGMGMFFEMTAKVLFQGPYEDHKRARHHPPHAPTYVPAKRGKLAADDYDGWVGRYAEDVDAWRLAKGSEQSRDRMLATWNSTLRAAQADALKKGLPKPLKFAPPGDPWQVLPFPR